MIKHLPSGRRVEVTVGAQAQPQRSAVKAARLNGSTAFMVAGDHYVRQDKVVFAT